MKIFGQILMAVSMIVAVMAGQYSQRLMQRDVALHVDSEEATMSVVYRCGDAGADRYLSYPQEGCSEIYVVSPAQANAHLNEQPASFTEDEACATSCKQRKAGYAWADRYRIEDPLDCSGASQSFVVGCQVYAKALNAKVKPIEAHYAMLEHRDGIQVAMYR